MLGISVEQDFLNGFSKPVVITRGFDASQLSSFCKPSQWFIQIHSGQYLV